MQPALTWIRPAWLRGHRSPWLLVGVFAWILCCLGCQPPPARKVEPVPPDSKDSPPRHSLEKLRGEWDSEKAPDWQIVELLALMCQNAYLPPKESEQTPKNPQASQNAEQAFHEMGLKEVQPAIAESMVAYLVCGEEITVVVFRGTDDLADWLVNLDCRTADTPHGTIHKGFYEAYHTTPTPAQSLRSQILARLKERPPKHLWITGHSLGGALALVCAYDLIENETFQISGVLTFGQPMVAQPQLSNYLNQRLASRYTYFGNGKDIVPRVPPTYVHCGARIWFHDGQIERFAPLRFPPRSAPLKGATPEDAEDPLVPMSLEEFEQFKAALRKADRVSRGGSLKGNLSWLRDHAIENYRERVHSALNVKDSQESAAK